MTFPIILCRDIVYSRIKRRTLIWCWTHKMHPIHRLTHWSRDKMVASFPYDHFKPFFSMNSLNFDQHFTEICSQGFNWQYVCIRSGNCLAPNRRPAIIWTNDDLCIYASIGHSELMDELWSVAWWRHQMETFSALLAICAWNSPVPGDFPTQRPVTRSLMFSLICVWINGWANREAGDLRPYRAHYDVTVMDFEYFKEICTIISINHCICPVQTLNTLTVLVNLISYHLTVTGISVCLCFIINAFVVLFLL